MSATVTDCTAADDELCAFPEFELCALLDDEHAPRELTVYPGRRRGSVARDDLADGRRRRHRRPGRRTLRRRLGATGIVGGTLKAQHHDYPV